MRSFAETDKVFDGDQAACEAEDHIDRNEAPKLKPGEGGTIYAKPHRLANDNICFNRRMIGKTFVKKINDGKDYTCDRHEGKNKKSPARPDVWKCLCDDII